MPTTARIDHALVRQLAQDGLKAAAIARALKCHPQYVRGILSGKIVQAAQRGKAALISRIAPTHALHQRRAIPRIDAFSLITLRTRFVSRVREISPGENVFKSGFNSAKIGKRIRKGRWRGFEVYTLTLEERATCPTSCALLATCYGNNMHFSLRWRHGPELEARIGLEIARLSRKHPRGFAVRLHVLGDFYSVQYVRLWEALLDLHPQLHIFGFTARIDAGDPIARELIQLSGRHRDRFQMRFSGAPWADMAAQTVESPEAARPGAIVCPQQQGKTQACVTCALCWSSRRPIAFLHH